MKTFISDNPFCAASAAVADYLKKNGRVRLVLDPDARLVGFYSELGNTLRARETDSSSVIPTLLYNLPESADRVCRNIPELTGIERERFTEPEHCREDSPTLTVLAVGPKAQLGLNDVAAPFSSACRTTDLTDSLKKHFFSEPPSASVPGCTLGIRDILDSDKLIVIASGEEQAEAVFGMLYARTDSTVPAAFLQLSDDVDIFLDGGASSKL